MQTESLVQEGLSELMEASTAPGRFAVSWRDPARDLALTVDGVGPIGFPVSAATARALRAVARPARFGRGEETVLDRRVRDTWVIAKRRVRIDGRRWRRTLGPALERVHATLGMPSGTRLQARLHDLLLYEEGQFFLAHRDAEKSADMVGTLVVTLPSSFRGGESVVAHESDEVVVRGSSSKQLTFLAFFSDCEHEVKPVRKGHRAVLTYELRLHGTPEPDQPDAGTLQALGALVAEHFATPATVSWDGQNAVPDRLVYLLDHEYTPSGLRWRRLKGIDGTRAALFRRVAEDMDAEVHLASAEVHERWGCEPEDAPHHRFGRGRPPAWATALDGGDDEGHPPLTELYDADVMLDAWVDVDDQPTAAPESLVEPAELCFSRPSDEMVPFRVAHEGYMGNWGDTVDRWYRRAAIVLWPRSRALVVRGKHDAPWAAGHVRETVETGAVASARAEVQALLPYWVQAARSAGPGLGADVLHAAHLLDDAALAAEWVAPLKLSEVAVPDALAKLIDRYGRDWLDARFDAWGRSGEGPSRHLGPWQRSLPGLVSALPRERPAVRAWLAGRLEADRLAIEDAFTAALEIPTPSLQREALARLTERYVAVLHAATLARAESTRRATVEALVAGSAGGLRGWAVEVARQSRAAMSASELTRSGIADAVGALVESLRRAVATPPRDPGDWSMDATRTCDCALCDTLHAFLSSRDTRALDWPLAKDGRRHVHQQLDARELPVSHTTRRQGRPYTLLLRKSDALFQRENEAREDMRSDLAWLEAWPRRRTGRSRQSGQGD